MTYHVRATKTAARNLFEKIVKENYFDLVEDTKEDLKEAITLGCWESKELLVELGITMGHIDNILDIIKNRGKLKNEK